MILSRRDLHIQQQIERICEGCGKLLLWTRDFIRKAPYGFNFDRCDKCAERKQRC